MPRSRKAKGVSEAPDSSFDWADEDIDFTEVPELDERMFARGRVQVPVTKEAISLRVDSDVLDAFRKQGPGYQTRMNEALRMHVAAPRRRRNALRIYREDGKIGVWLGTDEIEEFIGSIEHAASLASELDEAANWKWLIIALHNAGQGAFVCALRGEDTSGESVFQKNGRLADFKVLYSRVKDRRFLSPPFTLPESASRDAAFERLVGLRNDFVHFAPKGLSLELSGMPKIVSEMVGAISHLALEQPTFGHHLRASRVMRIQDALADLVEGVEAWWARIRSR